MEKVLQSGIFKIWRVIGYGETEESSNMTPRFLILAATDWAMN